MFGNCKLKYILPLEDMEVLDIPDGTITKINNAFELKGSVKSITVHAASAQEKQQWMQAIQEQITNLKSKLSTLKTSSGYSGIASGGYGNDDDDD